MAGESSAVPLEAAYRDGITQRVGRDSLARASAQRGESAGEARMEVKVRKEATRLDAVSMLCMLDVFLEECRMDD
jgi:hypothetical protein